MSQKVTCSLTTTHNHRSWASTFQPVSSMAFTILRRAASRSACRSEEHTSELQSLTNLVCRLLLEKQTPARGRERDRATFPGAHDRMNTGRASVHRSTWS